MAKKNKPRTAKPKNGANLGSEPQLWQAAEKLRGNMDAADYKYVVLGLIFLKYMSDASQERYGALKKESHADPEDRDEYTPPKMSFARRKQPAGPNSRPAPNNLLSASCWMNPRK